MADRPAVKPHDWIKVEGVPCVVAVVRGPPEPSDDIEVVFNPQKPANVDVRWTGPSAGQVIWADTQTAIQG